MGGGKGGQSDSSGMYAAMASAQAADEAYKLGEQQFQWSQQVWQQEQPLYNASAQAQIDLAQQETAASKQAQAESTAQWQQYQSLYAPLEAQFVGQAENWASPQQQALVRGQAMGAVASQGQGAINAAAETLRGYGVNPSSPRYASLYASAEPMLAASEAGAGTTAAQNLKLQQLGLEGSAINTGRGMVNAAQGLTTAGTGAASAGAGAASGAGQTATQNIGSTAVGAGATSELFNAGANNMNSYVNAVNGYNNSQAAFSQAAATEMGGLGSAIGGITGLAMFGPFRSDARDKTDIHREGTTREGIPLYSFRYKEDPKTYPKVVGPMAQDIAKIAPHRVGAIPGSPKDTLMIGLQGGGDVPPYDPRLQAPPGANVNRPITQQIQENPQGLTKTPGQELLNQMYSNKLMRDAENVKIPPALTERIFQGQANMAPQPSPSSLYQMRNVARTPANVNLADKYITQSGAPVAQPPRAAPSAASIANRYISPTGGPGVAPQPYSPPAPPEASGPGVEPDTSHLSPQSQLFIMRSGGLPQAQARLSQAYPQGPPGDDQGVWKTLHSEIMPQAPARPMFGPQMVGRPPSSLVGSEEQMMRAREGLPTGPIAERFGGTVRRYQGGGDISSDMSEGVTRYAAMPASTHIEDRRPSPTQWPPPRMQAAAEQRYDPTQTRAYASFIRGMQLMGTRATPEQQRYLSANMPAQLPTTPMPAPPGSIVGIPPNSAWYQAHPMPAQPTSAQTAYQDGGNVDPQFTPTQGGGPSGIPSQPVPPGGTPGGGVPPYASPSMGQQTDDVPAMLTADEFVIPKDVAVWKGHEYFAKQIDMARKGQQAFSSRDDIGGEPTGAIPQQPTFTSRPGMMGPAPGGAPQQLPQQRVASQLGGAIPMTPQFAFA